MMKLRGLSAAARAEIAGLGLSSPGGARRKGVPGIDPVRGRPLVCKRAVHAPEVLNEAPDYAQPASFSRGMRVELPGATLLFISGTASVDERGVSVHRGDFKAQCLRTFRNLTRLLASEGASWHDVARTTCYIKDIERHYAAFNEVRTAFMAAVGLDPLPASTGIQAKLCRPELLVEIEAIAVLPRP